MSGKQKEEVKIEYDLLNDADVEIMDAFVLSAAFKSLQRVLEKARQGVFARLLTETDVNLLFKTQGVIEGMNWIENLPLMLKNRRQTLLQRKEEEEKREAQRQERPWLTK